MEHYHKLFAISLLIVWICLFVSVNAIGVGPQELELTVERGKETVISRTIQVLNSDTHPLRIKASVSGSISQFVSISPEVFTLPAGPGLHSLEPSPYKTVKVTFNIPREVSAKKYTGQILFTEEPVKEGMISTAAQVRVKLSLTIGNIAQAEFPNYVNVLMGVLVLLLSVSIIIWQVKR